MTVEPSIKTLGYCQGGGTLNHAKGNPGRRPVAASLSLPCRTGAKLARRICEHSDPPRGQATRCGYKIENRF